MELQVRPMRLDEVDLVTDYFHGSSPDHLEMIGVDPTRIPDRITWRKMYETEYAQPIHQRKKLMVVWELEGHPFGFSTADKIIYGAEAYMHLHVVNPDLRHCGNGAICVRKSIEFYFQTLKLERLYCEPNAFNVAPNRTLQKVGFRYVKTHMTVPGPLNFYQAVTRWVIEGDRKSVGPE